MKIALIRLLGFLFASFASLVSFAATDTKVDAPSLPVVNLQLRWKHQFQFAGYYAALEQGFYREAGLDVRIHEGGPGKVPVDEVLAGRAQYGVGNSEVLFERLQGKPLVAMSVIFQHSPSVLLARADSGIRTPHDLVGKKLMLMSGRHDSDFYAMFAKESVKPEAIQILPTSYDIGDLVSGKVDAFNSYLTNEPFILNQQGVDYVVINPSHYGIDYYGDILFSTEQEISKHPDQAEAFRQASLRGWRYAMDHPEEVIDLLLKKYAVPKAREHLFFEASSMRSLVLPDVVEIGHMNPGRWQAMAEAFKLTGLVGPETSLELDGFIYDPLPHAAEQRVRRVAIVLGSIVGICLVVVVVLYVAQRRLRREVALRKAAEQRLQDTNDMLARTNRIAKIGGWERNIETNEITLTEEAARIRELEPGQVITHQQALAYYVPEERPYRIAENERAIRDGSPWEHESLLTLPSGKQVWIYSRGEAVMRDGKAVKLIGAMQDITERKLAELALLQRTRELEMHNTILRQIHQGRSLCDVLDSLAHQVEALHPGMLCSIRVLDESGKRLALFSAPSLPDYVTEAVDSAVNVAGNGALIDSLCQNDQLIVENLLEQPVSLSFRAAVARAGLQSCWMHPIKDRQGRLLGTFSLYQRKLARPDEAEVELLKSCASLALLVIEYHRAEEKIRNLAFFDALTQLPNRRLLDDRLGLAMASSKRSGRYAALMFLDLDNFKPLNDGYGHAVGDLLLIEVAERLSACVREIDTVARFGGDEFVIMITELDESRDESAVQARLVAEKIRSVLAEPYRLIIKKCGMPDQEIEHHCTASIGVVLFINHVADQDEILKWADAAMYQAKEDGRNSIRFYD